MQSRFNSGSFAFNPNFSWDRQNLFLNSTAYNTGGSPTPIVDPFLLLNGDDFLLLNTDNLELL